METTEKVVPFVVMIAVLTAIVGYVESGRDAGPAYRKACSERYYRAAFVDRRGDAVDAFYADHNDRCDCNLRTDGIGRHNSTIGLCDACCEDFDGWLDRAGYSWDEFDNPYDRNNR